MNIDLKPILDYLSGDITKNVLLARSCDFSESIQNEDNKSYSPTALSNATGYSKHLIYTMLRDGLPYYQIGNKKMIRLKEFEKYIERYKVSIPRKDESYSELETRIRKGAKLGNKLLKEFEATDNPKTLSQFSLWLFENNKSSCLGRTGKIE